MATIMLYANKANQMPELVQDVKKSILDYKAELFSLKNKLLNVDQGTCNMDDIVSSIQAATRIQEEKIVSLETLQQSCERFVEDADRIDGEAADIIRQRKDDFYEQYSYLKPECEKNDWEKFCNGCKKVGEWCREHWTAIVTVALIVVVITIAGAWGPFLSILAAACQGLGVGAVIGGLMGGLSNVASGRPFFEGFKDGVRSGALVGAFFGGLGGLGWVLGGSCKVIGFLGPVAKALPVISRIFTRIALGMFSFDLLSLGISLFSPDDLLVQLNKKLHSSKPYNVFQFTVTALAAFSSGFVKGWAEQRLAEDSLETIIKNGKVSVDDIKANPNAFSGKSAEEIADVLRKSGYDVTIKASTRSRSGAQIIKINNPGGGKNISQVQVSPGGGRHGSSPYVKISTSDQGIIKVVDGIKSTYKTDGNETAIIIFSGGK